MYFSLTVHVIKPTALSNVRSAESSTGRCRTGHVRPGPLDVILIPRLFLDGLDLASGCMQWWRRDSCGRKIIDGQRVIYFVDHSGVLSAMIKGSSRDDLWRSLLLHYESFDSECPAIAWYARVPSKSNAADGPSRGGWRFPVVGSFVEDALRCFGSGKVLEQTGRLVQG